MPERQYGGLRQDVGRQRDAGRQPGVDPRRGAGLRRNGRLRGLLCLTLVLLATPAFGHGIVTELLLYRTGESLRTDVTAHDLLDERTAQTIESGLAGICVYLLRLEDRLGQLVVERQVERSLSYDTWKERFVEAYAWPGNIRELKNFIERLVILRRRPSWGWTGGSSIGGSAPWG